MIPADLTAELTRALRAAAAVGELPEVAATVSAAGTWRRPSDPASRVPGAYATSLPLTVAAQAGIGARAIAYSLAGHARGVPWIRAVTVTGPGYLTIRVAMDRLAGVAARTAAAGPQAAESKALVGRRLTAPALPDLASAPDWTAAWRAYRDAVLGKLAGAAGAAVIATGSAAPTVRAASATAESPVAAAVAYRGPDAVRYVLARTPRPDPAAIARALGLRLDLSNPFMAVRYAHADAASVGRWADDLGLPGALDRPEAIDSAGPTELQPRELTLLDTMSWLSERTAAAARRRRPADLAGYLEGLAAAWLACAQDCPALPFRGRAAPADPTFRLLLAAATRVSLAAGLGLLALTAPDRV